MLKKQYLKSKPTCKVTFSLPVEAAKDAQDIRIVGEFNDWSWENGTPMKATSTDYTATLELETGRSYQFRYFIDQHRWENDHAADGYVPSPYSGIDNSVVALDEAPVQKAPTAAAPVADTASVKPEAAVVEKKAPAKKATPKKKKAKAPSQEDLKKIEGIGPKIAGLLNAAGIQTFSDLAEADVKVLKDILADAGSRYKMHDPTTWTEQAALAAAEKWDELKQLQIELKGGKRK